MLPSFLKYGLTLQAEIVAMVAEEVQHKADEFIKKNADEGYDNYLSGIVNQLESTFDSVSKPIEALDGVLSKVIPENQITKEIENTLDKILLSLKQRKHEEQA